MATLNHWEMFEPIKLTGRIKRCSPVLPEGEELVIYLHLEEQSGTMRRWQEVSLTFRLSKETSLNALLVKPGDEVTVEWVANECKTIRPTETIAFVKRFHLTRDVPAAYGKGFRIPSFIEK